MHPSALYESLSREFGEQNWWPVTDARAFTPTYKKRAGLTERQKFEIMAGAILAQNTAWVNVMRALENLNREGLLDCAKLAKAKKQKIARLVRPSGYFNMKAEKLKRFAVWLEKNHGGKPSSFFGSGDTIQQLRSELLSLHGIGNETADSMLLYAGNLPSFVIDAYTLRFMERFYAMRGINYVEAKHFFERSLPADAALFNEFHALLVELGKNYCKKSNPRCEECCVRAECGFAGKR
ncbi:MAG: hypothetical protein V1676_00200 [Candidatus Diapherotrites archaeon]